MCGTDGRNYSSYCVFLEEACKPENVGVLKLKHRGACGKVAAHTCSVNDSSHHVMYRYSLVQLFHVHIEPASIMACFMAQLVEHLCPDQARLPGKRHLPR